MPELPEVESVRRQLEPALRGRTIVSTWHDPHPAQRFHDVEAARGHRIEDVGRRGKYLILELDRDRELVLHLGMTGSFRIDDGEDTDVHDRARFALDDGRLLSFRDPRRFGRVSVVGTGDRTVIPMLAALGPEPLTDAFDPEVFADDLRRSRAPVKALLLGQRLVAGVGNIYADESLWRARIHPASRRVGHDRAVRLHQHIQEVLAAAIEREGTTFRDYQMVNGASGRYATFLDVYGKAGLPCPRCGTTLRRSLVAQRGTTHCPRCQRG
ncbi:MAG: bifunctional DNA-formamidopyrimidine glycosylase/DNA-(apurinic or apyrimidinic site) lyase [Nitriliruptorales bacterium]|nr:bifunctional DNA-formamidopyrimidine glycosylase/DNA-(apurinic or apyrimidinic site) lyase [Nitriliruptorales bacterium]